MKKLMFSGLVVVVIGFFSYKFFAQPNSTHSEVNVKNEIAEGIDGFWKKTPPKVEDKLSLSKPAIVDLKSVKLQATQLETELSLLNKELDKNLQNQNERKKIEDKYKMLTTEYNKLVLQIVKAEPRGGEVLSR